MRKMLWFLFLYVLLAVILLPVMVTILFGGFGRGASYVAMMF